jgi:hypothetical protein
MNKPKPYTPFDLDDEFEDFMRKACPEVKEYSVQYRESRRVFAAGCAAMYYFCAFEVSELPEDEAVKELEKLRAQLREFFKHRLGFSD